MYRHIKKTCKVKKQSNVVENPETTTANVVGDLVSIIKKQQNQIDALADMVRNKTTKVVNNDNSTHTVINNNIVYITDHMDYLSILEQRFGTREKSIEFIKNKLHNKLQGEVDVFSEIHLQGPPNTWPIRCPDKSKKQFYLVQPDNSMIPDPGGVTTHKRFYRNLQTAVLKLINQELAKVVDHEVGSETYEQLRDSLLDDFDLQAFQTRALEMSQSKPGSFLKQLIDTMSHKEVYLTF